MDYTTLSNQIQLYAQNFESAFVANIPYFVRQSENRIYNTVQIPALRKNVTGTVSSSNKYLSCPLDFLSAFSLAVYTYANPSGTGLSGATQITVSNAANISAGQIVSGTGIANGTKVVSVNGTAVTLDKQTTGAVSGSLTFQGDYTYLLNKDVNFMREAYPNPLEIGDPAYYALFGPRSDNQTELTFILAPTPNKVYTAELHYYFYPESIVQGYIATTGVIVGGSGYTNGVYREVPLVGGSGQYATADIVVAGGVVVDVTISNPGSYYLAGDVLTASQSDIGPGTLFAVPVTSINNPNGTSWLGDNYDPVLLYGSLVEAYIFMKGEQDVMMYYEKKFQDALLQLKRLGDGLERGDAYRDGQAKIKVT